MMRAEARADHRSSCDDRTDATRGNVGTRVTPVTDRPEGDLRKGFILFSSVSGA